MIKWKEKQYHCPVEVSMDLLSGKWKCLMLWHLNEGTKRYKELERIVPGVSQKMLTQQLKELENPDGHLKIPHLWPPQNPPLSRWPVKIPHLIDGRGQNFSDRTFFI